MRRSALLTVLVAVFATVPARAGTGPSSVLHRHGQRVSWSGTLTVPDPMGCGEAVSNGCDHTLVRVAASRGTWVTVTVADSQAYVLVTESGQYVASNGEHEGLRSGASTGGPTVTFQQARSGTITYDVGVSSMTANGALPETYTATATISGSAFDRVGQCFVGSSGVDQLKEPDDGTRLHFSVRLVSAPADAPAMHKAAKTLIEIYDRINIGVRVSFDTIPITGYKTYPYEVAQRAYHGVKPAGVDVVYVLTDQWSGGFSDCIGGVAYPEKGFAVGSINYTVSGVVPVPVQGGVPAGMIAAHEIGHQLGAQHQQSNCVEAIPQEVQRPASDGWVGPCTVMGPLAVQDSETFSTLERATIRSFVRRYAHG